MTSIIRLVTGQEIRLACGHPRKVQFNDAHDSGAWFWCGPCDGMRAFSSAGPAPTAIVAACSALLSALKSANITTLDEADVAALESVFGAVTWDRREALAERKRQLWQDRAVHVPAGYRWKNVVLVNSNIWPEAPEARVALVRRTDTGQHYVVSTNREETLTWRSDADGNPYMSADPHIRESVVEAACGRGMTRMQAISAINEARPGQLVSGYPENDTDD